VGSKLRQARVAAKAEAKKHEAERTGATADAAATSVELVLVNRKSRVDEFYDQVWGGRTRNVRHSYSSGTANGRNAGYTAGQNANTNTGAGRLGGTRGAIGR
jgi:hypothetical protein